MGQPGAQLQLVTQRIVAAARGHLGVNLIDQVAKRRIEAAAWMVEGDGYLGDDLAGV